MLRVSSSQSGITLSQSRPSTSSSSVIKTIKKKIISRPEDNNDERKINEIVKNDVQRPVSVCNKDSDKETLPCTVNLKIDEMGQCGDRKSLASPSTSDSDCEKSALEVKRHFEALPLLKQRLGYMWERKMYTDVIFKLGVDEYPIEAHRTILASASEVFQELLFDSKPLITDAKFVLYEPDFSVPAFQAFVKAFYTNEIPISLTLPMALEVFYATKKYQVGFLQDQVLNHIRTAVTVSNVFEALRVSTNMIELTFIVPICWTIIEQQTRDVLEYHLETMDSHTLTRVLERDNLNIEEFELFQYLVKWGAIMCKQKGMKTTGKNKRQFIDNLVKYIRFTTMTTSEINEIVVPSRIMEPREIQAILTYANKSEPKLPIPYKMQTRIKPTPAKISETILNTRVHQRSKLTSVSDSIVVTGMAGSPKIPPKRNYASKLRSKRSSAVQSPRI